MNSMDTAPKDGTRIKLFNEEGEYTAYWSVPFNGTQPHWQKYPFTIPFNAIENPFGWSEIAK